MVYRLMCDEQRRDLEFGRDACVLPVIPEIYVMSALNIFLGVALFALLKLPTAFIV